MISTEKLLSSSSAELNGVRPYYEHRNEMIQLWLEGPTFKEFCVKQAF